MALPCAAVTDCGDVCTGAVDAGLNADGIASSVLNMNVVCSLVGLRIF